MVTATGWRCKVNKSEILCSVVLALQSVPVLCIVWVMFGRKDKGNS